MPSCSAITSAVVRPARPSSGRTSCMHTTSTASARSWRTARSMRSSSGGSVPQKLSVTTRRLLPTVHAARRRRFGDDDLDEARQRRREPLPPPLSEILARGITKALDLVEDVMIQRAHERTHVLVDLREVHHPAELGVGLALDHDIDLIAVPVHAGALVARRHLRKEVRRFESIRPFEARTHPMAL